MNRKAIEGIGKDGWLPFWFGSKFNKRLVRKRIRTVERKEVRSGIHDVGQDARKGVAGER